MGLFIDLRYCRSRFVQFELLRKEVRNLERGLHLAFELEVEILIASVLGNLSPDNKISNRPYEERKMEAPIIRNKTSSQPTENKRGLPNDTSQHHRAQFKPPNAIEDWRALPRQHIEDIAYNFAVGFHSRPPNIEETSPRREGDSRNEKSPDDEIHASVDSRMHGARSSKHVDG
jgi:hypothetical protein